jgi:FkbM family methyltransferase
MNRDTAITAAYVRLARSERLVRLAIRARNVANALIARGLSDGEDDHRGEAWLVRELAPGCRIAIDVGANEGDWSQRVLEVNPAARVIAYEPGGTAFGALERRLAGRAELVRSAVSDRAGEMTFYEDTAVTQVSSLLPIAGGAPVRVPVVTLDEEIEHRGLEHVDLLKIDVEGFDLHVLRGASRALREGRIGTVQFEYNFSWARAGSALGGALSLLEDAGFEVMALRAGGLVPLDYDAVGEFFHYANLVATRDRPARSPTSARTT